jgi:hypothetical protein
MPVHNLDILLFNLVQKNHQAFKKYLHFILLSIILFIFK